MSNQAQGTMVGKASNKTGGAIPVRALLLLPPLGRSQVASQGLPKGREEVGTCAALPAAPACVGGEEMGRGTQVARLSAGRLDMRSWELLLLRMESWVPPFTPLLARDGCLCLKSMVK